MKIKYLLDYAINISGSPIASFVLGSIGVLVFIQLPWKNKRPYLKFWLSSVANKLFDFSKLVLFSACVLKSFLKESVNKLELLKEFVNEYLSPC